MPKVRDSGTQRLRLRRTRDRGISVAPLRAHREYKPWASAQGRGICSASRFGGRTLPSGGVFGLEGIRRGSPRRSVSASAKRWVSLGSEGKLCYLTDTLAFKTPATGDRRAAPTTGSGAIPVLGTFKITMDPIVPTRVAPSPGSGGSGSHETYAIVLRMGNCPSGWMPIGSVIVASVTESKCSEQACVA